MADIDQKLRDVLTTAPSRRPAIIDIGSNSVRLVVYAGPLRAPVPVFNEKLMVGLGSGLSTSGAIDAKPYRRAIAGLARFNALTRAMGITDLTSVATAAVRDARSACARHPSPSSVPMTPRKSTRKNTPPRHRALRLRATPACAAGCPAGRWRAWCAAPRRCAGPRPRHCARGPRGLCERGGIPPRAAGHDRGVQQPVRCARHLGWG